MYVPVILNPFWRWWNTKSRKDNVISGTMSYKATIHDRERTSCSISLAIISTIPVGPLKLEGFLLRSFIESSLAHGGHLTIGKCTVLCTVAIAGTLARAFFPCIGHA